MDLEEVALYRRNATCLTLHRGGEEVFRESVRADLCPGWVYVPESTGETCDHA